MTTTPPKPTERETLRACASINLFPEREHHDQ